MRGHSQARLLTEFSGVAMSSRRTESRNLTGNGKVDGSRMSPRAVRRPVNHDTWIKERGTRVKEATANGQKRDAEARKACGKEKPFIIRRGGEPPPTKLR